MELSQEVENQIGEYGLVSVVMPNYNGASWIKETIESVLAQTYTNWELLFVDDCSTDNSLKMAQAFSDERIKTFRMDKNSGAAAARNKALRETKGKWIAFLDSDDLWEKEKLEKQLAFMVENGYGLTYTHACFLSLDGEKKEFAPKRDVCTYKLLLRHNDMTCSTVIYNAERLGKVEMPIEAVKREDCGCWLKILKTGVEAHCYRECLTTVRVHSSSVSYSKKAMIKFQWHMYRKVEKLSFCKSVYYMCRWAINGIRKYGKK